MVTTKDTIFSNSNQDFFYPSSYKDKIYPLDHIDKIKFESFVKQNLHIPDFLKPTLIYLIRLACISEKNFGYPQAKVSQLYLSKKLAKSVKTIQRHLKQLCDENYIIVKKRFGTRYNLYCISNRFLMSTDVSSVSCQGAVIQHRKSLLVKERNDSDVLSINLKKSIKNKQVIVERSDKFHSEKSLFVIGSKCKKNKIKMDENKDDTIKDMHPFANFLYKKKIFGVQNEKLKHLQSFQNSYCLTDEDIFSRLISYAKRYSKKHPNAYIYGIIQNDGLLESNPTSLLKLWKEQLAKKQPKASALKEPESCKLIDHRQYDKRRQHVQDVLIKYPEKSSELIAELKRRFSWIGHRVENIFDNGDELWETVLVDFIYPKVEHLIT